MALGALKVYAEEEASDIAGEARIIGFLLADFFQSFGEKKGSAFFCFVGEIRTKDFAHECVEWAVFGDGLGEEPDPVVVFASAFHPLHVECFGDAGWEARIGEEAIDEGDAFCWVGVSEERASFLGGGNGADEVEMDSAEELGVGGGRGYGDFCGGGNLFDGLVDARLSLSFCEDRGAKKRDD